MAGGIVTSWRRDLWHATSSTRRFSITTKLTLLNGPGEPWWLTNVYGPTTQADKAKFLLELRDVRVACPGPWLLCGDFNLIYMARDKNNGWLHHGLMRRFRRVLDDLQLDEIHLSGRLYTWSNGRDPPPSPRLIGSKCIRTINSAASPRIAPIMRLCYLSSTLSRGRNRDSGLISTGPRSTAS